MIPAHLDCPVCPRCRAPVLIPAHPETGDPLPAGQLWCPACGEYRPCSPEERAQADRAEAAWEQRLQREEAERDRKRAVEAQRRALSEALGREVPLPPEQPERPAAPVDDDRTGWLPGCEPAAGGSR